VSAFESIGRDEFCAPFVSNHCDYGAFFGKLRGYSQDL